MRKKWKTEWKTGIRDDRSYRIGISSGGERCNMVVMKCLLDRKGWKPKMYFANEMNFGKRGELKMARSRKVMKVRREEKAQGEGAATALRQIKRHSMCKGKGRTDCSTCKWYSGVNECFVILKNAYAPPNRMAEISYEHLMICMLDRKDLNSESAFRRHPFPTILQ